VFWGISDLQFTTHAVSQAEAMFRYSILTTNSGGKKTPENTLHWHSPGAVRIVIYQPHLARPLFSASLFICKRCVRQHLSNA